MSGRVLVVDDNKVIRQLIKVNLELEGFEVVTATDGAECLEIVHQVRPDVVTLDVVMPRLDGLRTAARLRADVRTRHLPIAIVSAGSRSDGEGCEQAVVDAFLGKPFEPGDLVNMVRRLMRVGRMRTGTTCPVQACPGEPPVARSQARAARPAAPADPVAPVGPPPRSGSVPHSGPVPRSGVPQPGTESLGTEPLGPEPLGPGAPGARAVGPEPPGAGLPGAGVPGTGSAAPTAPSVGSGPVVAVPSRGAAPQGGAPGGAAAGGPSAEVSGAPGTFVP